MADFDPSKYTKGKKGSRDSSSRRDSRSGSSRGDSRGGSSDRGGRSSFGGRSGGRGLSRESRFGGRSRRDTTMTKVTCSSCGSECEVPFKPTSDKPVYCSECFSKKDKSSSDKPSNKCLDIINEKLDKIMKALKIE